MFSVPRLQPGQDFPPLPYQNPQWHELTERLNVVIDASASDDQLTQYTRHAVGWVERLPDYCDSFHADAVYGTEWEALLGKAGLVHQIEPHVAAHDYGLVDGGGTRRYDIRLAQVEQWRQSGKLAVPELVVFGGQAPRREAADSLPAVLGRARALHGNTDAWGQQWLDRECHRATVHQWDRPFATEWELALLSLYKLHGKQLRRVGAHIRSNAEQARIHPSIPLAPIAADVFKLQEQTVTVLQAPARWREHAGRRLPVEDARPTGRSCFKEWLDLHNPPENSSVILLTHQPNIYRSWLDVILRAAEAGRADLRITAAGAPLETEATVGDVLEGLGNLIINNYNYCYEGGIANPPASPFVMQPRHTSSVVR